jgi:hypothetical protein
MESKPSAFRPGIQTFGYHRIVRAAEMPVGIVMP